MAKNSTKAVFIFALAAMIGGCASRQVALAPQSETGEARDEVAGVTITAAQQEWSTRPLELSKVITPLHVTIQNNSGRPVRLRYEDMELRSPAGKAYAVLPPYSIDKTVRKTMTMPEDPGFSYDRFYLAPYASGLYGDRIGTWDANFASNWSYYDRYYGAWPAPSRTIEIPLPTKEMITHALPEGVIEDGGMASGYVYFEKVGAGTPEVDFMAELVDARTGGDLGKTVIPLAVRP